MTVSLIAAQFLSGLTTAMFLFLIASGLSLVFGVMRVLNFAHGSFYMIGAYMAWQVVHWLQPTGGPFWIAALAAGVAWRSLGGVVERLLLRHLYGAGGTLPTAVHLRAGADPGRRGEIHLGHRTALGATPAGPGWRASRCSVPRCRSTTCSSSWSARRSPSRGGLMLSRSLGRPDAARRRL